MNRWSRNIIVPLILLLGIGLGCSDPQMNVILVVVDTLRADHCSPYGSSQASTPTLKRFAAEGITFDTVVAQASFTMASMGTVMTSTYPHHHGAGRHPSILDERNLTLAEVYRDADYTTGAMICNPLLEEGSGFEQGFDYYKRFEEQESFGARGITDEAITWIEKNRKGPFFLWLHLLDPHFPYLPRPGFLTSDSEAGRAEYMVLLKRRNKGKIASGDIFFNCDLSGPAVREAVNTYDSEIGYTDHYFGQLLEALDRLDLKEKTLVVFTSDHGESLGEHGLHFSHGFSVYDEALRVPWIMRLPAMSPLKQEGQALRRRVDGLVQLLDLPPTVLSLSGIEPPAAMMGRDLTSRLKSSGPAAGLHNPAFSESEPLYLDHGKRRYPQRKKIYLEGDEGKWRSVRQGRYKLIMIPGSPDTEYQLFDLEADPGERRDISGREPDKVAALAALLQQWRSDPAIRESMSSPELDEEWRQRLKNIGYTE